MERIIYLTFAIVMMLLFISPDVRGENTSAVKSNPGGIYLSPEDFANDSLSVSVDFTKREKLYFDNFLIRPYITITKNGKEIKYRKDEIFAVKNRKGEVYRLFQGNAYRIAERGMICIYSRQENGWVYSPYNKQRKYAKLGQKTVFYFSARLDSPVYQLTQENLLMVMAKESNQVFQNLDQHIKSAIDLTAYDQQAGKFHVNVLLEELTRSRNL